MDCEKCGTSGLFFSPRTTALVLVAVMLCTATLPWLISGLTWDDISNAETFLAFLGLLVVVFAVIRRQDQRRVEAQAHALATSEARLRGSEESYRSLVTEVNDGLYACDESGVLTFANPGLAHLLGLGHPDEAIGRRFLEFVAPAMVNEITESFRQALESGQTREMVTVEIVRPDGTSAVAEVKSTVGGIHLTGVS